MSRRIVAIIATVGTLVILFLCNRRFCCLVWPWRKLPRSVQWPCLCWKGSVGSLLEWQHLLCFALRWLPVCLP